MRYEIKQIGSSFYVHWMRGKDALVNGWFNSYEEADRWGRRHAMLSKRASRRPISAPYCDEATDSGHSSANGLNSR